MAGTSNPENISTRLQRVADLARQAPDMVLTSLAHHIDMDLLREAYRLTRKDAAVGVDGQTAEMYAANLEERLQSLLGRLKTGMYRAPSVRRVHIPKGDGKTRPIGIPTLEDKILQRAVVMVLSAVYEQDFLDCSYGFRPGRSAHQALQSLWEDLMKMHGGWVLEADIQSFFDTLDHDHLRGFLDQRVRDGVLRRVIGKWLNAGVVEAGETIHFESGTPQGGVVTPPTMLTKAPTTGARHKRAGANSQHDSYLLVGHIDPLHQGPDELASCPPVRVCQSFLDPLREVLDSPNDKLELRVERALVSHLFELLFESGDPLLGALDSRLELRLFDESLSITVDHPRDAGLNLVDLRLQLGWVFIREDSIGCLQSSTVFRFQALWVLEKSTSLMPHSLVEEIGPHLLVVTHALSSETVGVRAGTPVVRVVAAFPFASGKTDRPAVVRVAALLARQQTLQEVTCTPFSLASSALILPQLLFNCCENLLRHYGWYRDSDPLFRRHVVDRVGVSRLFGATALCSQPWSHRSNLCLAEGGTAHVGGVLEHAPHRRAIPPALPTSRRLCGALETTADFADRCSLLSYPREDLADDAGLFLEDLQAGLTAPFVLAHIAVPVGSGREDIDETPTGRVQFAPAHPLQNLGTFVFSHHALHLQQKVVLGALTQLLVQEDHLYTCMSQFIHDQDLVGVLARETIRRVHVHAVQSSGRGQITKPLQCGTHQRRAAISVIDELQLPRQLESVHCDTLAQGSKLTVNRASFRLLRRRHACIDRDLRGLHFTTPPTHCSIGARTIRDRVSLRMRTRRRLGATRSYALARQSRSIRLASNRTRTSRLCLDFPSSFTATTSAIETVRSVGSNACQRSSFETKTIARSQPLARNPDGELYHGFVNIVGGVVSPLLANIYLHEVLDKWFEHEIKPRLEGPAILIRYADDFAIVFSNESDARRVLAVLPKRFGKYGLTLHPEKTRLVRFQDPTRWSGGTPPDGSGKPETFDLLGFTHYWGLSRRGKWIVKRKTARNRLRRAVGRIDRWCRKYRHDPLPEQQRMLGLKLRGHYSYYGITGNGQCLQEFRNRVHRIWRYWLSRRSHRARLSWTIFQRLVAQYPLPPVEVVHSVYR